MSRHVKKIGVYLNCPENFRRQACYVFRHLLNIIGLPFEVREDLQNVQRDFSAVIVYGMPPADISFPEYHIEIAAVDYKAALESSTPVRIRRAQLIDRSSEFSSLPPDFLFLFNGASNSGAKFLYEENSSPVVTGDARGVYLQPDLIASAFYLLNLEDERRTAQRDSHGRFNRAFSPAGTELYDTPVIDIYARLLEQLLNTKLRAEGNSPRPAARWPHEKKFALVLTHDVDSLPSWTFSKMKRAARGNGKIKTAARLLPSVLRPRNWSGNFEYIARLENEFNAHSTFFFIGKPRDTRDPAYQLTSSRIKTAFRKIKEYGFYTGLHGSYASADNKNYLSEERQNLEAKLGRKISGNRQHYLRFDAEQTPEAISAAGFAYDSTLGFPDSPGYRCGTSFPFYPWNPAKAAPYNFLEVPLTIMDTVLFLQGKMEFTAAEAWSRVLVELETARRNAGVLTINWHNNNIHPGDVTGYTALYRRILTWAAENGGWMCASDEVQDWWKNKTADIEE